MPCPAQPVDRNESGKWKAVVQEIRRMHKTGRPVLVSGRSGANTARAVHWSCPGPCPALSSWSFDAPC